MRESLVNKPAIVYCAVNSLDRTKFYIGVTSKKLSARIVEHRGAASRTKENGYFQNAIRKHGFDVFNWYTLSKWDNYQSALNEEIRVIKLTSATYNVTSGGEGAIGAVKSIETRKKISNANKGKKLSAETKEKLRIANTGRMVSKKTREKISKNIKGRKHTDQTKKKISISHVGKSFSEETRKKMSASRIGNTNRVGKNHSNDTIQKMRNKNTCKPVICIEDNLIFKSIREAARFYKTTNSNIGQLCSGTTKNKMCRGKHFKYYIGEQNE